MRRARSPPCKPQGRDAAATVDAALLFARVLNDRKLSNYRVRTARERVSLGALVTTRPRRRVGTHDGDNDDDDDDEDLCAQEAAKTGKIYIDDRHVIY